MMQRRVNPAQYKEVLCRGGSGLECCRRRRELEKRTQSGYISFFKISETRREDVAMEANLKKRQNPVFRFFTNMSEEQVRREDVATEVNLKKNTIRSRIPFFFKFVKRTVIGTLQ